MKQASSISVYDFDKTIYKGDASIDFIFYCLLHDMRLWYYFIHQLGAVIFLLFGLQPRKDIKQKAFLFLRDVKDIDKKLTKFWQRNEKKIARWYLNQKKGTDVIISASPEFLLRPVTEMLGIDLIATVMDKKTGIISGQNCRSHEKVARLKERYGNTVVITRAYSDSLSDKPLFDIAKKAFIVRKDRIIPFANYYPSFLSQLYSPSFVRFLVVGGANAFLGILFAFIISLLHVNPIISFIVGYLMSLIVSYYLNAIVTFRQTNFTLRQFVFFCISYIPNFLIQLLCVYVLIDKFQLYPIFAYILAVAIATPITFLLLSNKVFKRAPK